MKKLVKLAVGAAMLGGLAVTAAAPADAGVAVGIGIGAPAYPNGAWCYHHPHRCGYRAGYAAPAYGAGYYGPAPAFGVYVGGHGYWDGHRYWPHRYWAHGGWRFR